VGASVDTVGASVDTVGASVDAVGASVAAVGASVDTVGAEVTVIRVVFTGAAVGGREGLKVGGSTGTYSTPVSERTCEGSGAMGCE